MVGDTVDSRPFQIPFIVFHCSTSIRFSSNGPRVQELLLLYSMYINIGDKSEL